MYSLDHVGFCLNGKRKYPTERAAKVALVEAVIGRNYGKKHRREHRYYQCSACNQWHLTSEPLRVPVRVMSLTAADDSQGQEDTSALYGAI